MILDSLILIFLLKLRLRLLGSSKQDDDDELRSILEPAAGLRPIERIRKPKLRLVK